MRRRQCVSIYYPDGLISEHALQTVAQLLINVDGVCDVLVGRDRVHTRAQTFELRSSPRLAHKSKKKHTSCEL